MKPLNPKDVKYIVVHCTASKEGVDLNIDDIDQMHKRRGFSMVGYHKLIKLDGTVEDGRPLDVWGAHVRGYNDKSIGIAYVGGLDSKGKAKDTRTEVQIASMVILLQDLKNQFPDAEVLGHRDLSPDLDGDGVVEKHEWMKECPCFDIRKEHPWLNN